MGRWLIIMFFLITATLFLYDGTKMMVIKRDMQTALNISATGSIIDALDPAPLRVGQAPRINSNTYKYRFRNNFIDNYGMKYDSINVKIYSIQESPPAVVVAGETTANASMLGFLAGSSAEERTIRGRAVVVYEAKETTQ